MVLAASCSQPHLKARECTVLANTLHKAARLQKLWLSKMLDQGLLQQSRQHAQNTHIIPKPRHFKAEDVEETRGSLIPRLFHCFHGRIALDGHSHLLTSTSSSRTLAKDTVDFGGESLAAPFCRYKIPANEFNSEPHRVTMAECRNPSLIIWVILLHCMTDTDLLVRKVSC